MTYNRPLGSSTSTNGASTRKTSRRRPSPDTSGGPPDPVQDRGRPVGDDPAPPGAGRPRHQPDRVAPPVAPPRLGRDRRQLLGSVRAQRAQRRAAGDVGLRSRSGADRAVDPHGRRCRPAVGHVFTYDADADPTRGPAGAGAVGAPWQRRGGAAPASSEWRPDGIAGDRRHRRPRHGRLAHDRLRRRLRVGARAVPAAPRRGPSAQPPRRPRRVLWSFWA